MNLHQRDLRQRDLLPRDLLSSTRASVVGVGAIGRQVALQLSAIGVGTLQLVDHDMVEEVNLAPQGYLEDDLGRPKVEATAELCRRINSGVKFETVHERFRRSLQTGRVLFCCVDRIETRRVIWEAVSQRADFFADGSMSAEVLRVLVATDSASHRHYPTTLFSSGEAYEGSCTARSTIFCANVAAGLMLSQFSRWLRHLPVEVDLTLNLLASELTVGNPKSIVSGE